MRYASADSFQRFSGQRYAAARRHRLRHTPISLRRQTDTVIIFADAARFHLRALYVESA